MGTDIGVHVGANFLESFPERVYKAQAIKLLFDQNRLGEKTGSGFYKFDAKRKAHPDPELKPLLAASRKVRTPAGGELSWLSQAVRCQAQACPTPKSRG